MKSSIVHSRWSIVKELSLCLLSGILLTFSFPNFNFWLFAWLGFVPLFFVLKKKSKWRAFLFSYFTGIIFWSVTIYWLVHVTLPGTIILILYLALYFGFFGLTVSTIDYRLSTIDQLFIPSVWVLLEYLRSHLFTGFPWAPLGYSQYLNLPIIQIADITGVWGVSFLVMMSNVVIWQLISQVTSHKSQVTSPLFSYIFSVLFLLCILGYGYYNLYLRPATCDLRRIKISVIQGNIPQELKWDPLSKDFIINRYITLTGQAVKDKPDLIIWPEAALPVVLEEEPLYFEKVSNLIKEIHTPLLLGAVTSRDGLYYNSAILVSGEGKLLNRYDKLHLVPFGEYIPLRKIFRFLETIVPIGDFTRGKEYTVFKLQAPSSLPVRQAGKLQANFSVLICFEDLFPRISRQFAEKGADFLVNITNDAWFKKTASPYQHLAASVFRAVENRVFLLRSANTGVSGFIAPNGKIISLVQDKTGRNIFIGGYSTQEIVTFAKKNISFYTRYGDIFVTVCFLFVLYGMISLIRKPR